MEFFNFAFIHTKDTFEYQFQKKSGGRVNISPENKIPNEIKMQLEEEKKM